MADEKPVRQIDAMQRYLARVHLAPEVHQVVGHLILITPVQVGERSETWPMLKNSLVVEVTGIGFDPEEWTLHLYTSIPGLAFRTHLSYADVWLIEELHLRNNTSKLLGQVDGGTYAISQVT